MRYLNDKHILASALICLCCNFQSIELINSVAVAEDSNPALGKMKQDILDLSTPILMSPPKVAGMPSDNIVVNVGSGAGSIMYTSVVHSGWKFPFVFLTDVDEKYLFDVEVRTIFYHEALHR
jgi:hypothetical protein